MPTTRRQLLVSPLAMLAGCSSFPRDFREGDAVRTDVAHVLIYPRYIFGRRNIDQIEMGLTRIVPGKGAEDLPLAMVPNSQISIFEVPPGVYFLRTVRYLTGFYRHTFAPQDTLFQARSGQVNYPGDWIIEIVTISSSVSGSVANGYASAEYQVTTVVAPSEDAAVQLRDKYPSLNAKLPLRSTKIG